MKIHTEKEFNLQGQHFAFKLRDLYIKDPDLFFQLQDYYPFPVYINERKTSEYTFFNDAFLNQGKEIEALLIEGRGSLEKIADNSLLKLSCIKAVKLHENNDYDTMCHYLQKVLINKEMTLFFTSKILIDEKLTLNVPFFPKESLIFQKVFKELLPEGEESFNKWQRFQSLTKREKEIIKLIANGKSNKVISQDLFITFDTVKTHRKNIYKKLDINNTTQLVRLAILLELFDH
ncbi:MAG: response regulator transcription factor [Marinicellaceae bacterium]